MVQWSLSASSCMWMCIAMDENYTECQHSMHFVLNGPTQFVLVFHNTLLTLLWFSIPRIPPSALLSCPRK
jgi:hypothetical protein